MSIDMAPSAPVVVFDLDDTLYIERDYQRSGVAALAPWVFGRFGVAGFAAAAGRLLDEGPQPRLFDAALASIGIAPTPAIVTEMIGLYRGHRPRIALAPDAAHLLARLNAPRALVTDGFLVAQRAKIDALGLASLGFDPIICTDQWGRAYWKPHPRAFRVIAAHWPGRPMAYVADNPSKDFLAPRSLGWRTVQIDRPYAVHGREPPGEPHRADLRIRSFEELGDDPLSTIFGASAGTGIAA